MQLNGQNFKLIHRSSYSSPLVIAIIENDVFDEMNDKITEIMPKTNASFLIINGSYASVKTIKDSVNFMLNQGLEISKKNIYLVIVGNKLFFDNFNSFNSDLFPSKYYVNTENSVFDTPTYNSVLYSNVDMLTLVNTLKEKYLWELELEKLKNNNKTEYNLLNAEYGYGLASSVTMPISMRTSTYIPISFVTYDIYAYRSLNANWKVYANFTLGFKIPDPQKEIQEQIQSQMDMSSIMSGGSSEVNINMTLEGRMLFSGGLEARYYLNSKKKFKPFVGIGLTNTYFMSMQAKIDTTMTVSSSMMNGGNLGSAMPDGKINSGQSVYKYWGLLSTGGLEYRLSDYFIFNLKTSYNLAFNTFNTTQSALNHFNFQLGLTYRIQGKKHRYYEYLRLK
jgi:hypothetical protein